MQVYNIRARPVRQLLIYNDTGLPTVSVMRHVHTLRTISLSVEVPGTASRFVLVLCESISLLGSSQQPFLYGTATGTELSARHVSSESPNTRSAEVRSALCLCVVIIVWETFKL